MVTLGPLHPHLVAASPLHPHVLAASSSHAVGAAATGLTFIQVVMLSLLQGVAELFPISSLGHTVILPALLRWNIDQHAPAYLAFVVLLHFGTAVALLTFYWRDWLHLIQILIASLLRGKMSDDPDERFIWLVIVGTIPAAVLALLFQSLLQSNFGNPKTAAAFLALNGLLMLGGEVLRRRQQVPSSRGHGELSRSDEYKDVDKLGWGGAVIVGLFQSLALLPGFSRSGATMVGGLAQGLRHHEAMRFTFMLATPIIVAASIKTTPDLLTPAGRGVLGYAVLGCLLSGVAAYLSVRFLDRYFKTNRLDPFAYYCLAAGIVSLVLLGAGL